jgi:2-polyprenyl-3-methyl-5-hydroxy-6-metoxy-1,4-benzoquinol methylase
MGVQERLTLQAVGEPTLIAAEHVHRYEFAAALCAGLRVLDLCCGSGYGAEILATRAATVHGVDYDAATIDLATRTLGEDEGLSFELADALGFLRQDLGDRFDAIVCFEGLEHLPDVTATLGELRRHAADGIAVIASVPNSRGLGEDNEFHLTEFGYAEARAAFADFPAAVIVHQYLAEGSLIVVDDADDVDMRLVGLERAEPPYANHFLLVSGERLGTGHSARMQLAAAPNYNRYMQSLERANTQLRRRNNQLTRLLLGKGDSAAPSYVKRTEERLAELAKRTAALEDLERELEHRQRRIERLEDQIRFAADQAAARAAAESAAGDGLMGRLQRRLRA